MNTKTLRKKLDCIDDLHKIVNSPNPVATLQHVDPSIVESFKAVIRLKAASMLKDDLEHLENTHKISISVEV